MFQPTTRESVKLHHRLYPSYISKRISFSVVLIVSCIISLVHVIKWTSQPWFNISPAYMWFLHIPVEAFSLTCWWILHDRIVPSRQPTCEFCTVVLKPSHWPACDFAKSCWSLLNSLHVIVGKIMLKPSKQPAHDFCTIVLKPSQQPACDCLKNHVEAF